MKKHLFVITLLILFITPLMAQSPAPVELTWAASPSTDILAGYNIYRAEVSGGPYTQLNAELITGLTYTDSTVTWNTTYYYVCRAVSIYDVESIDSNEAWVVRTAPAPEPPVGLQVVDE